MSVRGNREKLDEARANERALRHEVARLRQERDAARARSAALERGLLWLKRELLTWLDAALGEHQEEGER